MNERVSNGTKAAAQIARELLRRERRACLQKLVIRPTVVFVKQLNVILIHVGGQLTLSSGESYLATGDLRKRRCGISGTVVSVPSDCALTGIYYPSPPGRFW